MAALTSAAGSRLARSTAGGGVSGLACRSLGPTHFTCEKVADVPVASAPAAFRVRVWEIMSRGRGPRVGCPPSEGADVVCPQEPASQTAPAIPCLILADIDRPRHPDNGDRIR